MDMTLRRGQVQTAAFCGLTATALKMIAVLAMVLQHFAIKFMDSQSAAYFLFLSLGKITAPIMCYFIAEGYHFTHDRKRYLGRLFLFALLSHIPHALVFGVSAWQFWKSTSVMWSLTLGMIALIIFNHKELNLWVRILAILGCCVLSYPGNWNCVAIIWILGFGIFRNSPVKKWGIYLLGVAVNILEFFIVENDGFLLAKAAYILPVLLLSLYNGQRGNASRGVQKFFYWFYPVHLILIFIIQTCLI